MTNYCLALTYRPGGLELVESLQKRNVDTVRNMMNFIRLQVLLAENIWIQRGPPGSGAPESRNS